MTPKARPRSALAQAARRPRGSRAAEDLRGDGLRPRRAVTASMRAITSSMPSSSSWTSSALPSRDIREPESSRPSTRPPRSWPLPRASSSSVMPSAATSATARSRTTASTSSSLVGRQPTETPDQAGVGVVAGEGEDRVGQAAALADLLEQPGRRAAAEGGVEHAEGEAAVVVAVHALHAEHQVDLLERAGRPRPCPGAPAPRSAAAAAAGPAARRRRGSRCGRTPRAPGARRRRGRGCRRRRRPCSAAR